jgi:membrane-bound ClpP family serine protease
MTVIQRSWLVIVLMTLAIVAFVVDYVEHGWTVLGAIGVACFALVIAAELRILARAKPHV